MELSRIAVFVLIVVIAAAGAYIALPLLFGVGTIDDSYARVDSSTDPSFDILNSEIYNSGDGSAFVIQLRGQSGLTLNITDSIYGYFWLIGLNPSTVGLEDSGILALAAMKHTGFDDTPLVDENLNENPSDDGAEWHSHWVVFAEDGCGEGSMRIADINSLGYPVAVGSDTITVFISEDDTPLLFGSVYEAMSANLTADGSSMCTDEIFDRESQ